MRCWTNFGRPKSPDPDRIRASQPTRNSKSTPGQMFANGTSRFGLISIDRQTGLPRTSAWHGLSNQAHYSCRHHDCCDNPMTRGLERAMEPDQTGNRPKLSLPEDWASPVRGLTASPPPLPPKRERSRTGLFLEWSSRQKNRSQTSQEQRECRRAAS